MGRMKVLATLWLMTLLLTCAGILPRPVSAAPSSPEALALYLQSLEPLREHENFKFTVAEYAQVIGGESVFKARKLPGSDIAEGGVARILQVPAWQIWRAVVDEPHHKDFMPQIFFADVLEGAGQGRLIFDFLEIPFLDDRQWVVEAKHWGALWTKSSGRIWMASFKTPEDQAAVIRRGLQSGKIPDVVKALQEDAITIKESRASYTLIELPDGRTLVEYRVFTDPGGSIPAWALNGGAPLTAKKLVEVLETRAREAGPHYAQPGHPTLYDPAGRPMGLTRPTPPLL